MTRGLRNGRPDFSQTPAQSGTVISAVFVAIRFSRSGSGQKSKTTQRVVKFNVQLFWNLNV
jgi:hypothetical protein